MGHFFLTTFTFYVNERVRASFVRLFDPLCSELNFLSLLVLREPFAMWLQREKYVPQVIVTISAKTN